MKCNFEIKDLTKHRFKAIEFIQRYHYSPVMPTLTKHILGFFIENELKGVLTLGWGTRPRHTFTKIFPTLKEEVFEKKNDEFVRPMTDYYFEIGKMCLSPDLNNSYSAGSQMVSATIRWMKKNTNCSFLYTMADGIMGKCGYVYQASNFYFGEQYWTDVYMMENGEKFHPRSSKKLCQENLEWERERNPDVKEWEDKEKVTWFTKDFMNHRGIKRIKGHMYRYMYPLNKKSKKLLLNNSSMDWTNTRDRYPKDKDLEWFDVTDMKNKVDMIQLDDEGKPTSPFDKNTFTNAIYNEKNISQGVTKFMKK